MPIKLMGKSYKSFSAAVSAVMRAKGWGRERASAYVGAIKERQEGGGKQKGHKGKKRKG